MISPTPQAERSRRTAALFALAALLILAGIGLRDPWPPDEPRFALAARSMVETGHWLVPHLGQETYPDKPPLFMWAIAAGYRLTGRLELAFLLPSALAGLGTLWLVFDLARRLWSRRVAVAAALALLTSHQFLWQSRFAQIDAFLMFWTMLGFYGFMRHCLLGPAWRWYAAGSLAVGLGVISKGVGFLPWLVLLPYALLRRGDAQLRAAGGAGDWRWYAGMGLALLPILAWLLPMLLHVWASDDPALAAYRDNILLKQTAERYVDPWHHHQPWWYLPANALLLWLPAVGLLPWLLPRWHAAWRARDARVLLPLGYMLLIFVFFSASPAKRGVYILPALPAFVLAAAPFLPELADRRGPARLSLVVALLLALLIAALVAYGGWIDPQQGRDWLRDEAIDPWPLLLAMAGLVLPAVWLARRRMILVFPAYYALLTLCWGFAGMPMLDPVRSARPIMQRVQDRVDGRPLALVDWREPLALFAAAGFRDFGRTRPADSQLVDALSWLEAHPDGSLLGPSGTLQASFRLGREDFMGRNQRQDWYLVTAEDLRGLARGR